jgi:uncharacterized protein YjbI with pentapeptide repeats
VSFTKINAEKADLFGSFFGFIDTVLKIPVTYADRLKMEEELGGKLLPGEIFKQLGVSLDGVDLSKYDLKGANLSGLDLSKANLSGVVTKPVDLSGANLQGCNLSGAVLENVNLSRAHLEGCNLSDVVMEHVNLSNAHLDKAIMKNIKADDVNFQDAYLSGSDLEGAEIKNSNLVRTRLYDSNLKDSRLTKIQVCETSMNRSDLRGAQFKDFDYNQLLQKQRYPESLSLDGSTLDERTQLPQDLSHSLLGVLWPDNYNLQSHNLTHAKLGNLDNIKSPDQLPTDLNEVFILSPVINRLDLSQKNLDNSFIVGAVLGARPASGKNIINIDHLPAKLVNVTFQEVNFDNQDLSKLSFDPSCKFYNCSFENTKFPDNFKCQLIDPYLGADNSFNSFILSTVRQDLHFPLTTINKSLFTEIMEPKSEKDLEDHLPWMYLVRDIFQSKPLIVKDTNEELNRINSSSRKDFDPIRQQRYWQNQIFLRYAVKEGISEKYYEGDLKSWLEDLHKIACSGLDGHNHYYDWNSLDANKFSSPSEGIMTRYQSEEPKEIDAYLKEFKQFLQLGISGSNRDKQGWLAKLAEKYVNVTISPPFKRINNSIVMNILNLMLQKQGMNEISHGNLDLSVFTYKDNEEGLKKARADFSRIFSRAILQTNSMLKEQLGTDSSSLNIPVEFVSIYQLYLEQLSKLDKSGVLKPETYNLLKYVPVNHLEGKSKLLKEIIEFKDVLAKGIQMGVFTPELFANCFDGTSKSFEVPSKQFATQKVRLLESLGLKSLDRGFDTSASTLQELLFNLERGIEALGILESSLKLN